MRFQQYKNFSVKLQYVYTPSKPKVLNRWLKKKLLILYRVVSTLNMNSHAITKFSIDSTKEKMFDVPRCALRTSPTVGHKNESI